ncbi:MAG: PaaI family thioesterase [Myxococcota bacterium]|jgi:acyl-coenzyme A thioesterase PaaI-like protein|nr:PaaI family thioesterase [Myxococcota bacterium]
MKGLLDIELGHFEPPTEELLCAPLPDCEHIDLSVGAGPLPSFLSGDRQSLRVRIRYFWRPSDGHLFARAWFGPGSKGPPGHAHGGSIAALLDEVMGVCAYLNGREVLAARIDVSYRQPLRLGSVVLAEGWVEKQSGRKVSARARLTDVDSGVLLSDSNGLFLQLNTQQVEAYTTLLEESDGD